MHKLVVTRDFGEFRRGDEITDPAKVEEFKNHPHAVRVATTAPAQEPPADHIED